MKFHFIGLNSSFFKGKRLGSGITETVGITFLKYLHSFFLLTSWSPVLCTGKYCIFNLKTVTWGYSEGDNIFFLVFFCYSLWVVLFWPYKRCCSFGKFVVLNLHYVLTFYQAVGRVYLQFSVQFLNCNKYPRLNCLI